MELFNSQKEEKEFVKYVLSFIDDAKSNDSEENEKRINGYIDKLNHSLAVRNECEKAFDYFDFDPSYTSLISLMGLLHDFGRFEQMKKYGTFKDKEAYGNKLNIFNTPYDHGDEGYDLLIGENKIRLFLKENHFDNVIGNVVRNHSKLLPDIAKKVDRAHFKLYKDTSVYELFTLPQEGKDLSVIKTIESLATLTVQDTDRLDIYRKILNRIWTPLTVSDDIDPLIVSSFKKGLMPSMASIKEQGKWNDNVGHLVRLSFVQQLNLVSVLNQIKQDDIIRKMYYLYASGKIDYIDSDLSENIKKLEFAYSYTDELVDELVRNGSNDGVFIDSTLKKQIIKKVNNKY